MSRGAKFLITVMGCLLMGTTSVAAQTGTTVITAKIAPVRIIVVDNKGKITQVISNTKENVTPTVHKNSPDGKKTVLTQSISKQYKTILKSSDTHKTGVIYQADDKTNLISYLFRYSRS